MNDVPRSGGPNQELMSSAFQQPLPLFLCKGGQNVPDDAGQVCHLDRDDADTKRGEAVGNMLGGRCVGDSSLRSE